MTCWEDSLQGSRPSLVPKLAETIGEYEMSMVPRSLCAVDGTLYIPTDKASLMHAIEDAKADPPDAVKQPEVMEDNHPTSLHLETMQEEVPVTVEHEITQDPSAAAQLHVPSLLHNLPVKVLIIDAMGVLQRMKKTPAMHKMSDLQNAFNRRIQGMMAGYNEGRVVFDRYMEESSKNKTRQKRATT